MLTSFLQFFFVFIQADCNAKKKPPMIQYFGTLDCYCRYLLCKKLREELSAKIAKVTHMLTYHVACLSPFENYVHVCMLVIK